MNNKQKGTVEAALKINIGGEPVTIRLSVEKGQVGPEAILPFVRDLTDKVVNIAIKQSALKGKSVSCQKGCGACCAQLVPVTETEVREIARLIETMPKSVKQKIMARFDAAKQQMQNAGLWHQLTHPESFDKSDAQAFGLKYFSQAVYCPFLVDQSCSIHTHRPIACREYLVSSDAKLCATPHKGGIEGIKIPHKLSNVLAVIHEDDTNFTSRWIPLIVAPYWQALHPNLPTKKPGPEWVEKFLAKLNH